MKKNFDFYHKGRKNKLKEKENNPITLQDTKTSNPILNQVTLYNSQDNICKKMMDHVKCRSKKIL